MHIRRLPSSDGKARDAGCGAVCCPAGVPGVTVSEAASAQAGVAMSALRVYPRGAAPLVIAMLASACLLAGLWLGRGPSGLSAAEQTPVSSEGSPAPLPAIIEIVFDASSGLGPGWNDYGWVPRQVKAGAAVSLDFGQAGGWIVARPGLTGRFGGLRFRVRAPRPPDAFLDVALDSPLPRSFPRVRVNARHQVAEQQGAWDVFVPVAELNPQSLAFDRLVFRSAEAITGRVELDAIGLTAEGAPSLAAQQPPAGTASARTLRLGALCAAPATPISPLIYGIAFDPRRDAHDTHQWRLGASARRWGGNPSTRYNWRLGDAWNTASDWFFTNVNYTGQPGFAWQRFLDDDRARGVGSALTVPIQGWVAKDTRAYSFPVALFGEQQRTAPENADVGNGVRRDGKLIPPAAPTMTSVPFSPADVAAWVQAIRARAPGTRPVDIYILDNEPMLWHVTHRDVHPEPTTYDELLERTLAYGNAVRQADPEALIAGPALWGWPAMHYSAADTADGFPRHADRRAHGDQPFLPWWLARLREHELRTGQRLIDLVDVHFYPQGEGIAGGGARTDAGTAARRIRSTRALWDPRYLDESWIGERIMLIPRLKSWIDAHYPGLGIQIGEWNFGAETHMSGGLATAEALGRYGTLGVRSAFYWDYPAADSPAFWAFRAYRDFDGQGARFLDLSVPTSGADTGASLFVSRNAAGDRLVAVLLNFDPLAAVEARLDIEQCGTSTGTRAFGYWSGAPGLMPVTVAGATGSTLSHSLPPHSITVLDIGLRPPQR